MPDRDGQGELLLFLDTSAQRYALLLVLALGGILNAGFDQVFVTYNPLVYSSGDIIDTMVYRLGFEQGQYSLATAAGIFKSIVGFILITTSNWMAQKFLGYRVI